MNKNFEGSTMLYSVSVYMEGVVGKVGILFLYGDD